MTIGRYSQRRDEPFYWWGRPYPPDNVPTLAAFIESGLIGRAEVALCRVLLRRGLPLFVVSEASGAGKSSLLHALVNETELERDLVYLRGSYETFDFLSSYETHSALLLVNEISPHLPAYLWGRPVGQLFDAMRSGYQVAGTAHASSATAFLHMLISPPLEVPAALVMRPMALVQLPRGEVVSVRPGARPGTAIVETFPASVSPGWFASAVDLLDAGDLDSNDVEAELSLMLEERS